MNKALQKFAVLDSLILYFLFGVLFVYFLPAVSSLFSRHVIFLNSIFVGSNKHFSNAVKNVKFDINHTSRMYTV